MIFAYLLLYALILLYGASKLGIGVEEAKIIFADNGWLHRLALWLYERWPSELAVRLPVIAVTLLNIALFWLLAKRYLKKPQDALLAAIVFSLLPAVLGSGVVLSKAPFVLFVTLLFLLWYRSWFGQIVAIGALFFDKAFAVLFLGTALYELYAKRYKRAFFYALLFALSLWLYGFDVGGRPRSYFLDTFATFSAIFSPLVFLYYFYSLYRVGVKEAKDIVWFVSATAFLFALILSFRQRIHMVDFAPFAVVGVVVMVRVFLHSLRVRLPKYRKKHLIAFWIVFGSLLINDLVLVFNELLFLTLTPKRHFAYRYYLAKNLAKTLHSHKISCVYTKERSLALQLRFYQIEKCRDPIVSLKPMANATKWKIPLAMGAKLPIFVTYSNITSPQYSPDL